MTSRNEEWFSDEDFWVATYTVMFPEERFAAATRELDQISDLVGKAPQRVLDLACGPGRHALPLARRGFTVTGVDQSEFLLEKARARATEEGLDVEWIRSDMREYVLEDTFDLVLNLFTSFGYFEDDAENQRVLRNVYACLRSGGTFVLDVGGKEVLARIFAASAVRDIPGGMIVHRRRVLNDWSRMENEWVHVQEGAVRSFRFGHWIYSGRELRQMLSDAGFSDIRIFGNLDGAPYGPEATRLVAVSTKA